MNFDYSDDQKLLKSEVRRYLQTHCKPERVRRVLEAPEMGYDDALWAGAADQGWLAATLPEAYGGGGLGKIELCVIAEELGRACAPLPFSSTMYLFAETLLVSGSEAQRERWLPRIAQGEAIGCLALGESAGPLSPERISARVEGGKLYGTKIPVVDGDSATASLVLARENGALGLYLVGLDAAVTRHTLTTIDPTRGAVRLTFEGAAAELVGAAGDGWSLAQRQLDRAAVFFAFEQLGGADRCLEMAREYALTRYAFGRSIGSQQAIKHKLADIYVKNELARAHAYYGAWAVNTSAPELPVAAAAARVSAADAYWFAAKEMIQTFGGVGTTWEVDCHLYFRRAQHLALVGGAPALWKEKLARALVARGRTTSSTSRPGPHS